MNQSQTAARIWWNARLDAKHGLPPSHSTVLGDTERQIQASTNKEIQHASRAYGAETRPLFSRLARLKSLPLFVLHVLSFVHLLNLLFIALTLSPGAP